MHIGGTASTLKFCQIYTTPFTTQFICHDCGFFSGSKYILGDLFAAKSERFVSRFRKTPRSYNVSSICRVLRLFFGYEKKNNFLVYTAVYCPKNAPFHRIELPNDTIFELNLVWKWLWAHKQ